MNPLTLANDTWKTIKHYSVLSRLSIPSNVRDHASEEEIIPAAIDILNKFLDACDSLRQLSTGAHCDQASDHPDQVALRQLGRWYSHGPRLWMKDTQL